MMATDVAAILPLPTTLAESALAPLAGQAAVLRVARTMVGRAVIVAAEPVADVLRKTLAAHELSAVNVAMTEEPGTRAGYLAAGLQYLKEEPRHVLIYDVRRPLTPSTLRDRVIAALNAGTPVVMPVLAVTDSVKAVDGRGSVTGTLDRTTLRSVQYPRGFTVAHLSQLLAQRTSDEFDELAESLRAGTPITFVDGDADAFIVELPRDAAFVEAIIARRNPAGG
jgi:2-C-methyl-D-erythritol 4-phosphate cytidylyltransferase